jgi:hypothetical protein
MFANNGYIQGIPNNYKKEWIKISGFVQKYGDVVKICERGL